MKTFLITVAAILLTIFPILLWVIWLSRKDAGQPTAFADVWGDFMELLRYLRIKKY